MGLRSSCARLTTASRAQHGKRFAPRAAFFWADGVPDTSSPSAASIRENAIRSVVATPGSFAMSDPSMLFPVRLNWAYFEHTLGENEQRVVRVKPFDHTYPNRDTLDQQKSLFRRERGMVPTWGIAQRRQRNTRPRSPMAQASSSVSQATERRLA